MWVWVPRHTTPPTHTNLFIWVFARWGVGWCGHLRNPLPSSCWLSSLPAESFLFLSCPTEKEGLGSVVDLLQQQEASCLSLRSPQKKVQTKRRNISSAHKLDGLGRIKERAPRFGRVFIRENHLWATLLHQLSKYAHASGVYWHGAKYVWTATWYNSRHTLITRKRDDKPRMIGGQSVVVRGRIHQLSVFPNRWFMNSSTDWRLQHNCIRLQHNNTAFPFVSEIMNLLLTGKDHRPISQPNSRLRSPCKSKPSVMDTIRFPQRALITPRDCENFWSMTSFSKRRNEETIKWRNHQKPLQSSSKDKLDFNCHLPLNICVDLGCANPTIFHCTHPHTMSLRRRYESLFSEARAQDVFTFLHQNNNKLYLFLHELFFFMSRLAVDWRPCKL